MVRVAAQYIYIYYVYLGAVEEELAQLWLRDGAPRRVVRRLVGEAWLGLGSGSGLESGLGLGSGLAVESGLGLGSGVAVESGLASGLGSPSQMMRVRVRVRLGPKVRLRLSACRPR